VVEVVEDQAVGGAGAAEELGHRAPGLQALPGGEVGEVVRVRLAGVGDAASQEALDQALGESAVVVYVNVGMPNNMKVIEEITCVEGFAVVDTLNNDSKVLTQGVYVVVEKVLLGADVLLRCTSPTSPRSSGATTPSTWPS
jgi:hypothetical protein